PAGGWRAAPPSSAPPLRFGGASSREVRSAARRGASDRASAETPPAEGLGRASLRRAARLGGLPVRQDRGSFAIRDPAVGSAANTMSPAPAEGSVEGSSSAPLTFGPDAAED